MSLLSFLNTAKVEEVARPHRGGGGGQRKPWNPAATILAIRVWQDGSVFPSQALVDRFNLEYPKVSITKGAEVPYTEEQINAHLIAQQELPEDQRKELKPKFKPSLIEPVGGVPGNGFDVIDSRFWNGYKAGGNMLFIAAVAKDEPKVDLFGATKYEDDGTPISKVMEQGSKTFGEDTLLPAIKELYGIELSNDKEYVDLLVLDELKVGDTVIDFNKQFSTPIMLAPKRVNRGAEKGKPDYVRREGATVFGFIPEEVVFPELYKSKQAAAVSETAVKSEQAQEEAHASVEA